MKETIKNRYHSRTTPKTGTVASEAPSGAERLARLSRTRPLVLSFSSHGLLPSAQSFWTIVY